MVGFSKDEIPTSLIPYFTVYCVIKKAAYSGFFIRLPLCDKTAFHELGCLGMRGESDGP